MDKDKDNHFTQTADRQASDMADQVKGISSNQTLSQQQSIRAQQHMEWQHNCSFSRWHFPQLSNLWDKVGCNVRKFQFLLQVLHQTKTLSFILLV